MDQIDTNMTKNLGILPNKCVEMAEPGVAKPHERSRNDARRSRVLFAPDELEGDEGTQGGAHGGAATDAGVPK